SLSVRLSSSTRERIPTRKGTASAVQPRQREHHRARAPALDCGGPLQGGAPGGPQRPPVALRALGGPAPPPARPPLAPRPLRSHPAAAGRTWERPPSGATGGSARAGGEGPPPAYRATGTRSGREAPRALGPQRIEGCPVAQVGEQRVRGPGVAVRRALRRGDS